MRILIMGGSSEANVLARRLVERPDIVATLSLAGRTTSPAAAPIGVRIGGFGGVEGLERYIAREGVDAIIDASHPFAAQISRNAAEACRRAKIPLLGFSRPAWTPIKGDRWIEVADMTGAIAALGETPRTAFLTIGRLSLGAFKAAPQHRYLVRTIDPPTNDQRLEQMILILARGPFEAMEEEDLMRREAVDVLVTKNSGGTASAGKLVAARRLGLTVIMVRRPAAADAPMVHDVEKALAWLAGHGFSP